GAGRSQISKALRRGGREPQKRWKPTGGGILEPLFLIPPCFRRASKQGKSWLAGREKKNPAGRRTQGKGIREGRGRRRRVRPGVRRAQSRGRRCAEHSRAPIGGVRVKKDYDLHELFRYINDTALFKNQWQLKTASQ